MEKMILGKQRRGIIFSLVVLLLLLNLIALKSIYSQSKMVVSQGSVEALGFESVQGLYNDIVHNAVEFGASSSDFSVTQRIFPFEMQIDDNRIVVEQEIPIKLDELHVFFDAVNSFEVWLEDSNYTNFFSGLVVDVNTIKNNEWSGSEVGVSVFALPSCLKYSVFDENRTGFGMDTLCEPSFDFNSVISYDVNVFLDDTVDFNLVSCSFDGNLICPQDDFNSLSQLPFVEINFFDENCSACQLDPQRIGKHFNPFAQNRVNVLCSGALCQTPDLNITISGFPQVSYKGTRQSFSFGVLFDHEVTSTSFFDFNFSIENPRLRLKKSFR